MNDKKFISKLKNFFEKDISNIKNISILEFGVREGNSTKFFLDICKKNNGKLFSVDLIDYSKLFHDSNWKFINCSDDNFEKVIKESQDQFNVIYIDTLHEAKHVKNLIFYYFNFLAKGGLMIIDDISWVPYCKNEYRNSFYNEINNRETFLEILNIYSNNMDKIDLQFSFDASGLAKIKKLDNTNLTDSGNLLSRQYSLKNIIRKFIYKFK